jgi:hypothetical protein
MRFSLKDVKADVQSRERMYGLVTRRTAHRDVVDVRSHDRMYGTS